MNSNSHQAQPGPEPNYCETDMPDISEQQFSASLEITNEPAHFELDAADGATQRSVTPRGNPAREYGNLSDVSGPALEEQDHSETNACFDTRSSSSWRDEVSAKVSSYKSRSRHKPRYPSLELQFDQPAGRSLQPNNSFTPVQTFSQSVAAEITALRPDAIPEPDLPRISLETTARVLEFPRPALPAFNPPAFNPDELAEPVLDHPRILEAPEVVPPPPAMGGILIEPLPVPEPERRPGFDVPLQSAPLSQRLWAGGIDGLLLAIAVASFGYVFFRITGAIPPFKAICEFGAGLFALLWPAYEYAFLVFSETTPGLRLARLEVQHFDGTRAPRKLRRWRVLASILSAASLGLGFAWCFLDEDQLTWHDRITRTHMASPKPRP